MSDTTYIIVREKTISTLKEAVNNHLSNGFIVSGGLCVLANGTTGIYEFLQAMTYTPKDNLDE